MFEGDDYIGRATNVASRLCDAAAPGQVLATREVVSHVPRWVAAGETSLYPAQGFDRPLEASVHVDRDRGGHGHRPVLRPGAAGGHRPRHPVRTRRQRPALLLHRVRPVLGGRPADAPVARADRYWHMTATCPHGFRPADCLICRTLGISTSSNRLRRAEPGRNRSQVGSPAVPAGDKADRDKGATKRPAVQPDAVYPPGQAERSRSLSPGSQLVLIGVAVVAIGLRHGRLPARSLPSCTFSSYWSSPAWPGGSGTGWATIAVATGDP